MTTTKKLVIAVIALSLTLVCVIGGTLAFLVAQSNEVTNTFTYGKIELELTEEEGTNKNGIAYEDVVPGAILEKDPTVTVKAGSEDCFVYVLIDNQLGDAAAYNIGDEWEKVAEEGTIILYRYGDECVAKSETDKDLPVFTELTFDTDLEKDDLDGLAGKNVVIKAYAHQEDNLDSMSDADSAAIAWAGLGRV